MAQLEHVNVTVADAQATAHMLVQLFDWSIRWQGAAKDDGYSIHVGNQSDYLAIYSMAPDKARKMPLGQLNHIGIVVDDLDEVEKKVKRSGYTTYSHADYEPGQRFYFRDENRIEFEIVSYSDESEPSR